MRKIRTNILTPLDQDSYSLLKDHILLWDKNQIAEIRPYDPLIDKDSEDRRNSVVVPGFIDIHVHLSQYRIRGRYEPALLSWLQNHVFPEEALSGNPLYATKLSEEFIRALFAQGTTTSVIYTAPFRQACETAFETAASLGARAFIGMTMMDQNSPQDLIQSTEQAYEQSVELYRRYHNSSPLLSYIFTPRFALSCSSELLEKTAKFARDNHAWIQTHLSENTEEIRQTTKLFGKDTYTQVYADTGLLTSRTILAHAIHLSSTEMDTLALYKCKIAHCPDSNFFLKSGEFKYQDLKDRGLEIGIGSDVAAGTTLNMPYHAKMVNYRQSTYPISPERLFYHITLGNAKTLELADRVGSLETGKEADLCFLRLPETPIPDDQLVSALCFYGHEFKVEETVIAGRTVFKG